MSLWLLENAAGIVDIEILQLWTLTGIHRLMLGEKGQDCNMVCASAGLSCSNRDFPNRVLNGPNVMPALVRVLGIECTGFGGSTDGQFGDDTFCPFVITSNSYDSMGLVTDTSDDCYYGPQEVNSGLLLSAVMSTCSSYPYSYARLCHCSNGGA